MEPMDDGQVLIDVLSRAAAALAAPHADAGVIDRILASAPLPQVDSYFCRTRFRSACSTSAISRQMGTGFGQQYHLSINPTQQAAFYVTSPTKLAYLTSPSSLPLQTWIHLAGTYDGAIVRIYVESQADTRARS